MEDSLGRAAAGLSGKRVLVVEDEALVAMLVEDELRDAGAEVVGPAPSVEDALRLVEAVAADGGVRGRKRTSLKPRHAKISYGRFCFKKKKTSRRTSPQGIAGVHTQRAAVARLTR